MGTAWRVLQVISFALGVGLAGLLAALLILRRRILRHVEGELGRGALLLAASARMGGYAGAAEGGAMAGILMLLATGLYFHSWLGEREIFVSGPSISWIGVSDTRGAPRSERHRIVVRFLNAAGKEDGIALKLLYPEQWVAAIKTHLITRAV
jgi:hypothetical protein